MRHLNPRFAQAGRELDAIIATLTGRPHTRRPRHWPVPMAPPYSTNDIEIQPVVDMIAWNWIIEEWQSGGEYFVALTPKGSASRRVVVSAPTRPLAVCRATLVAVPILRRRRWSRALAMSTCSIAGAALVLGSLALVMRGADAAGYALMRWLTPTGAVLVVIAVLVADLLIARVDKRRLHQKIKRAQERPRGTDSTS